MTERESTQEEPVQEGPEEQSGQRLPDRDGGSITDPDWTGVELPKHIPKEPGVPPAID